jgi:hypothetical protein
MSIVIKYLTTEMFSECRNRKRPALGDKAGLFQEKGDKSITLAIGLAIPMPFLCIMIFSRQAQH